MSNVNDLYEIKYEKLGESEDEQEKQRYWSIAFGLQEVDNLVPSKYMVNLAKENIKGIKTYEKVEQDITTYYKDLPINNINKSEKEADEVSLRIVRILNDNTFSFNYLTLKQYHKELFYGVDIGLSGKYIGNFRDYNISKKEPILNNDSVQYASYSMIEDTLRYDFDEERQQKYLKMTKAEQVERIAEFTSRIWQVHPFGEGNTRTTAVFIQKYLNSKGFDINNDLFKDNSLFFRNSLVRANYSSIKESIEADNSYLISFFENLILGKNNVLDNNKLYIENNELNCTNRNKNR